MMYKKQIDIEEVVAFLETCNTDTRIYIGCDSERFQLQDVWYADYALVVVVHINGKNGCKIFGAIHRERDYEQHVNKPRLRLMTEVYKISELYLELSQVVAHDIEVHLDLNPKEVHNSSIVVNEAIGYVKGVCGVIPLVKPEAFAASYGADRFKEIANYQ